MAENTVEKNELAEEREDRGVYTHQLKKTFKVDGQEVTELTFEWDKLTAEDSLAIEDEMQIRGKTVMMPEFSGEYLIAMAARACTTTVGGRRIGSGEFRRLPIADFNRIRSRARGFLLTSGS